MTCKSCKREVRPWDLGHTLCSPKDWVYCITTNPKKWVFDPNELTGNEGRAA